MAYYPDTSICIYYLKGLYPCLFEKIHSHTVSEIKIAFIVKTELLYGAAKSKKGEDNSARVEQFLLPFEVIPFDSRAAEIYARIRSGLAKKGTPVGLNNLIIASTVIANNGTLITNNEKEFRRIKDLQIEKWAAG
ncbi:MAG: type II toxin-antitoxin system VapC family toxin [Bacillota bacterium]